jgi:hypothetical protein
MMWFSSWLWGVIYLRSASDNSLGAMWWMGTKNIALFSVKQHSEQEFEDEDD